MDPILVLARLRLVYWQDFEGDGSVVTIPLIEDGEKLPILKGEKSWAAMNSFLTRLGNESARFLGGRPAVFERAYVEQLRPDGRTPWTQQDDPDLLEVRVALATPLNAPIYCGGEGSTLPASTVAYVNAQALHSSVNFGNFPRLHLVSHVRKPIQDA
jgi:hypothetical protein